MVPTLSNAQSQLDPESTGITADYFERDDRWVNRRIAPVFTTQKRRARILRWAAADALPTLSRSLRAPGGTGAELQTQAPTPIEFYINDGQLTSTVPQNEINEAEPNAKDQPFNVRGLMAAGALNLEMELRIAPYYLPIGSSLYPAVNPLFPATHLVASSGNWQTYNPATTRVIGPDIKNIVAAFDLQFGFAPNFAIIDSITDTFFMDQLMAERNTQIAISDYRQSGDILPSSNGRIVNGMTIIIPGARSEGTPGDAVYSPQRAWGTFPYFIVGYSPTLDGAKWNKVGDVYVAQADYQEPGTVLFQVNRQQDPLFGKNPFWHMWWNFARQEQVIKPDLVMAIGPVR